MWIMQVREEKPGEVWEKVKENCLFGLEVCVSLPATKPRSNSKPKQSPKKTNYKYRIVAQFNRLDLIIAVAADLFIAEKHWAFIEENLVSQCIVLLAEARASQTQTQLSPRGRSPLAQSSSTNSTEPVSPRGVHFGGPATIGGSASSPSLTTLNSSKSAKSSTTQNKRQVPSKPKPQGSFLSRLIPGTSSVKIHNPPPSSHSSPELRNHSSSQTPSPVAPSIPTISVIRPRGTSIISEEDQAIYQFLTLKFTTLTKMETQQELAQVEEHSLFQLVPFS